MYGSKRVLVIKPDTSKWKLHSVDAGQRFTAERLFSDVQSAIYAFNDLNGYDYICIPNDKTSCFMCKISFFSIDIQSGEVSAAVLLDFWGEEK